MSLIQVLSHRIVVEIWGDKKTPTIYLVLMVVIGRFLFVAMFVVLFFGLSSWAGFSNFQAI